MKELENRQRKMQEAVDKANKEAAAARKAEQARQKSAQVDPPKSAEGQPIIEGSVDATGKIARKFLKKNGFTDKFIDENMQILELMPNWNPGIAKRFLENAEKTLKQVLAQEAKAEARRAAGVGSDAVRSAPEFKTLKEAKDWFAKNLTNPESPFDDVVGTSKFTGDKNAYRLTANVTLMMRDRFGLPLPNYAGMRAGHQLPFGRSSANAAVHMQSDSLLMVARGMNAQDRMEGAWSQYIRYHGADGSAIKVGKKTWHARYFGEREKVRSDLNKLISSADDPDLKAALKAALRDDDWTHTVDGMVKDADFMYWRTMVHENGHRLHGIHKAEVDEILINIIQEGNYAKWVRATSKYSGKNRKEFLAEQFSMYMSGRPERVHPLLREFFEKLDQGGDFGEALFKLHNKL